MTRYHEGDILSPKEEAKIAVLRQASRDSIESERYEGEIDIADSVINLVERLEKTVYGHKDSLERLTARLSSILEPESADTRAVPPIEARSPLAQHIQKLQQQFNNCEDIVQQLLHRIDL